jgi:hypothetical protein
MAKSSASFTPETAPRVGGKPGRKRKTTLIRTNAELLAKQQGVTPLEFYAGIYNDESIPLKIRKDCADSAAPYLHRKMPQAVEMSGSLKIVSTFADAVKGKKSSEPTS